MKLKAVLISAVYTRRGVPDQTVILEECSAFVCLCRPCVTMQVDSVESDCLIVCV